MSVNNEKGGISKLKNMNLKQYEEFQQYINKPVKVTCSDGTVDIGIFWESTTWGDPDETEELELFHKDEGFVRTIPLQKVEKIELLSTL